jgi:hypothetical protein
VSPLGVSILKLSERAVKQYALTPPHSNDANDTQERWSEWQHEVLSVIDSDFRNVLDSVEWDDIDWDAWRPLFDQGCSAKDAVRNAFGRVA